MESLFKRFWWLAVHMWKLNHIKLLVCGHMWMNFSVLSSHFFCPHWCVSVITSVCVCLKFELTNLTGRQDFTYTKPLWKCASVRMMESRGFFKKKLFLHFQAAACPGRNEADRKKQRKRTQQPSCTHTNLHHLTEEGTLWHMRYQTV